MNNSKSLSQTITVEVILFMTSKELLYVEDALGHEQYFQTKCNEIISSVSDSELTSSVQSMAGKHQEIFNSFLNLLG